MRNRPPNGIWSSNGVPTIKDLFGLPRDPQETLRRTQDALRAPPGNLSGNLSANHFGKPFGKLFGEPFSKHLFEGVFLTNAACQLQETILLLLGGVPEGGRSHF